MSIRIQQAVAEAMARLRTSNVAGATTVLRDALGAAAAQAPGRPSRRGHRVRRAIGTAIGGRAGDAVGCARKRRLVGRACDHAPR